MSGSSKLAILAIATFLLVGPPVTGQQPDCTGISDVSDFDGPAVSDLVGLLDTVRVASGLSRPLLVTAPPGDVERLFIVEQDGLIRILRDGALLSAPFLDVSTLTRSPADLGGNEEGLLGLAFHPDYQVNGWLFVYYTDSTGNNNVVERFTRLATDPDRADPVSRTPVLSTAHTFATNHNGGHIAFGPNGYLYVGTGDGGSSCDPFGSAQDLDSNLGKLLRLDVDLLPFTIPPDNPFAGGIASDDDVWAYGLRNPWRWSFDRTTGALYIGDVGQDLREEIDCRPASSPGGANYGWAHYEGSVCPNPSCGAQGTCTLPELVSPIREYLHPAGCSVTGGYVYRGCRMSDLHGHYFYADVCAAFLHSFRTDGTCSAAADVNRTADLAPGGGLTINSIVSFGEDGRGELYVVDRGGEVFKIVPDVSILEVSGDQAPSLLHDGAGWVWEDLQASSSQPMASYKVYRSADGPAGTFVCAHENTAIGWPGGDPGVPQTGGLFHYVVTGVGPSGAETRPGNASDGTARPLDSGSSCPP